MLRVYVGIFTTPSMIAARSAPLAQRHQSGVTNVMLAIAGASLGWLIFAIALSGIYVAIEENAREGGRR